VRGLEHSSDGGAAEGTGLVQAGEEELRAELVAL